VEFDRTLGRFSGEVRGLVAELKCHIEPPKRFQPTVPR
jgi:hypothetical protein